MNREVKTLTIKGHGVHVEHGPDGQRWGGLTILNWGRCYLFVWGGTGRGRGLKGHPFWYYLLVLIVKIGCQSLVVLTAELFPHTSGHWKSKKKTPMCLFPR
jgi:hypothetical protein